MATQVTAMQPTLYPVLAAIGQAIMKTAKNIAEKVVDPYAEKRIRRGKSASDRANGAKAKNQQNKDSRAMWQNDSKRTNQNFPYASCNGKRNRYQVTGKGGNVVILKDTKK